MKFIKFLGLLAFIFNSYVYGQVSVYAKVDHIVPDGIDTQGGISLTVSGSTSPYTYTWNPGAISSKDITNINAGQYTVNVRSASSQTYTNIYSVGYKALWTGLDRCYMQGDTLISNSGATNKYSRAVTKNTLLAGEDGWFEFVWDQASSREGYIGFTDSISPNTGRFGDLDFAFRITSTGNIAWYENGNGAMLVSVPKIGDVLRLERTGNVITYKINGASLRSSTIAGVSAKKFKLKAALTNTQRLIAVGCSFLPSGGFVFPNFITSVPTIKHVSPSGISADGSINVVPDINGSYTYSWFPLSTASNSVTGLSIGNYKVNISDADSVTSSKYYNIGYKTLWTNLSLCDFTNDSLISRTQASNIYSGAVTKNTLPALTDGWFELVIGSISNRNVYIGFLDSLSPSSNSYSDIDYGFYFTNAGEVWAYENGTITSLAVTQRVGDVMRVERVGNTIYYKINDIIARYITISGVSNKILKIKSAISYPFSLVNIGCSFSQLGNSYFANYINAYPSVRHATNIGTNDASITSINQPTGSYTYTWQPSSSNTNPAIGLGAGIHRVNIEDSDNNISSEWFNVGYKVNWTNMNQCTFRNDSLVSTTGLYYQYCKAVSKNTLPANTDGWFEFVLNALPTKLGYIGFLDSININAGSYSDIDYGIYLYSDGGNIYSYENGYLRFLTQTSSIGDIIRIERIGNTINYKINGIVKRTVTNTSISQKAFKLKAALTDGIRIINLGCSFINGSNTVFPGYVELRPKIVRSSGVGINDGKIEISKDFFGLKDYVWEPIASNTATLSNLVNGSYSVTVSDSSNNTSKYSYDIGYKTKWKNFSNCFFRNDTLKGTGANGIWGYACTKNVLASNEDGWFDYVITKLNGGSNAQFIGFVDTAANNPSINTDIQYGFYYYAAAKTLNFFESSQSANNILIRTPTVGDVVRIEREGNTINYKVNGIIIRTITNTNIGAKAFKLKMRLYMTDYYTHVGMSVPSCNYNVSAGTTQTITCSNPSVTLTGTTTVPSPSYTWSAGGTSPNSFTTAVSAPDIYTLTVSNSTGCMASSTVAVVGSTVAPAITIESSSPTPILGLNAYWPFNGNADDVSGNANNGTITDATLTNDRFGNPNKAYYFNGTTSRIDVPNSSTVDMPNGQDYSISFWMKAKPGNVDVTPIAKNQYGAWSGYMFFANSTNGGYCNTPDHGSFYVAAGGGGDVCSNNAIYNDTTNWYFITGQYQASTNQAFMYVNTVLQTDVGSASGATSNTKQLSFGAYNDAPGFGYFKGALDDIRFYNRLLTQSEINSLYNETSALTTPTITCENPIINLKVNTSEPNLTYSWTPGGSSPTNSVTSVSSGGIYSVTVTNTLTGCVATNTIQIYAPFAVCPTIQNYENDSIQGSVNLLIIGEHAPYKVEWNGQKVPSVSVLLNALSSYSTSLSIDTVQFKHYADSISGKTSYSNLTPRFYPFKIFDSIGDSIAGMACVGSKINWDIKVGVVSQDDKISPRLVNNVNYYYTSAQKITQEGSFSLGSNYAVSTNYIDSKFNNHIEFTNPDSKQIIYAGLALRDTNIVTLNTAKTYFEFTGASTYKIHFLDSVIYTAENASGDVFSLDNDSETGEISYYKNGVKLVSRSFDRLNPEQGLLFKVICGSSGSRVANIVSVNASANSSNYVIGNVTDVTCFGPNSGTIDVYPYVQGSVYNSPISYELYKVTTSGNILVNTLNGPFTPFAHSLFQNLSAGKYEVKYTGLAYFIGFPVFSIPQVTFSSFFEIAYKPDWVSDVNVNIGLDRSLQKNGGAIYDWDAGASSINTLLAANTGWVEWTASADQNINAMGFSYADNDVTINTIDYSVGYIRINLGIFGIWNFYVKTNNSTMVTAIGLPGNILRSYNVNDKIRLEKDASQMITMYLNGNPIEQFSSSASGPMIIDASLKFLNGKISKPRCSFGCPITPVKNYAVLKSFVDGQYYKLDGNHLNFTVDGEYTLNRLKFKVYDNKRNVVISDSYNGNLLNIVNLKIGDNRYYLDCNSLAIGYYTLEVTNEKNEKLYLRFKR